MRENGISLCEVARRYSGNEQVDPRYEKKYAEFNAAAYGLAAAGFTDLDFIPGESPDFEVRSGGSTVAYLEIVNVKENGAAEYDGLLQQANVALNRRSLDDVTFAAKAAQSFCEIVLPNPPRKSDREAMVSEVVELFANENLIVSEPVMVTIDEKYQLLNAAGAQYIAVPMRRVPHVSFRKPAQSFASLPVADAIVSQLGDKCIAAARYEGSPLWLTMYCEVPGTDGALQILEFVDIIEISPFNRVFIGGQRRILELRSPDSR